MSRTINIWIVKRAVFLVFPLTRCEVDDISFLVRIVRYRMAGIDGGKDINMCVY